MESGSAATESSLATFKADTELRIRSRQRRCCRKEGTRERLTPAAHGVASSTTVLITSCRMLISEGRRGGDRIQMPRPMTERQAWEHELRGELPAQLAGYQKELDATPQENRERRERLRLGGGRSWRLIVVGENGSALHDLHPPLKRPHGGQQLLLTRELAEACQAVLSTLDVHPSDDAVPIDEESSHELGSCVPSPLLLNLVQIGLAVLVAIQMVERRGELCYRHRFRQFAVRIDANREPTGSLAGAAA